MPFWRCYYHVVWSTKRRAALITPEVEQIIFARIAEKSTEMHSPVLAVNGVEDHVHVAVMIAPRWSIADWARYVKGASSHAVNTLLPDLESRFSWQHEYGVTTFGRKNLETVLSYIRYQKAHHQSQNSLIPFLEDVGDESDSK